MVIGRMPKKSPLASTLDYCRTKPSFKHFKHFKHFQTFDFQSVGNFGPILGLSLSDQEM